MVALTQLAAERNLPREVVLEAVEGALTSAFKKDSLVANQDIAVEIAPQTGEVKAYIQRVIVEQAEDPYHEISLSEAKKLNSRIQIGEIMKEEFTPPNAGRIAARVTKQVVLQRLHEAERDALLKDYADKQNGLVSGVIRHTEPKYLIVNLGRAEAIIPITEQVRSERYRIGQRLKLYLMEVSYHDRELQLLASRTHPNLVRRLFELEVPEIYNGTVEVKAIAREAGYRSKVAVASSQEGVDSVGCCLGPRGIRIRNIIKELNGEKIDVIQWHPDPAAFIANALSPAPIIQVEINSQEKAATVIVPDMQLSLAIGKEGQNARLAAKLSGWRIDIKSLSMAEAEREAELAITQPELQGDEAILEPEAPQIALPLDEIGEVSPAEMVTEVETEVLPAEQEAELSPEATSPLPDSSLGEAPLETPDKRSPVRFAEELLVSRSFKPDAKVKKDKKKRVGRTRGQLGSIEEEDY